MNLTHAYSKYIEDAYTNSDITCNIICNRINVTTFRLTFLANYTLNFDNAYADCLNVTLINFKLMQIVLSMLLVLLKLL